MCGGGVKMKRQGERALSGLVGLPGSSGVHRYTVEKQYRDGNVE